MVLLDPGEFDIGKTVLNLPDYVGGAGTNLTTVIGSAAELSVISAGKETSLESMTLVHNGVSDDESSGAINIMPQGRFVGRNLVIDNSGRTDANDNPRGLGFAMVGDYIAANLNDVTMIGSRSAFDINGAGNQLMANNINAEDTQPIAVKAQGGTSSIPGGTLSVVISNSTFGSGSIQVIGGDASRNHITFRNAVIGFLFTSPGGDTQIRMSNSEVKNSMLPMGPINSMGPILCVNSYDLNFTPLDLNCRSSQAS